MTQTRKAVKAKFFFDNGDEVTVLTKNETERECMTHLARAIMCNRDRDGNMEEVFVTVKRSIHMRIECQAAVETILRGTLAVIEGAVNETPEEVRANLAADIMLHIMSFERGDTKQGKMKGAEPQE